MSHLFFVLASGVGHVEIVGLFDGPVWGVFVLVSVAETVRGILVMFVDCQCWFITVLYFIQRYLSGRDQAVIYTSCVLLLSMLVQYSAILLGNGLHGDDVPEVYIIIGEHLSLSKFSRLRLLMLHVWVLWSLRKT